MHIAFVQAELCSVALCRGWAAAIVSVMRLLAGPLALPGVGTDAYANNLSVALSAMPALQASAAANPLAAAPHHPVAHHHPALAAAALQLQGQLGHLSRLAAPPPAPARRATSHTNTNTNSGGTSHSDGDQDNDKSENRRARR